METINFIDLFQGIATLAASEPKIMFGRIFLMLLGFFLMYLGSRNVLEPLLMIPMGLGMSTINAGVMFLEGGKMGTLFVDPLMSDPTDLVNIMQINWLQPIYTLTFSNGLIACLVFMGIGVLLDVGYVMARPFQSMIIALFAELGTIAVFPIAVGLGLTEQEAASVATIGGADGPMVLFTSLVLAKHLFVPITVVGYLYLGLTYGGYPYLIKWLIPKKLRGINMAADVGPTITRQQKLVFAVVACTLLCLLFPVAAPLFFSLFLGVAVRESGLQNFADVIGETFLYGATFFLGLTLGVLCEANTLLDPTVLKLLLLGILALLISAIGGIVGGYVLYFATGKKFNPMIGIAGVSCVPTTAKVVQKIATGVNPSAIILPQALGANISGVITTAIITGVYIALLR
ncbi:Putative Na+-transporting decarboxylase, beta subunit [Candidatus Propionivibrio aalborgensis]|jgi:Na+-transporting malonate decarboxylase carboxybiotin decarboxylase subunit|uniref:oxaloacetate decarboxylase (Na(+) extruding) n=1 Tax=Candidatus Propionivibrio aalborgensis TaxID=1860101 RepID=A0A1A8XFF0_9RHOO|nr:sodium ion-translocating decarboxylase subunit beta [Candidatus Propionivibrio aalborgensis]MBK7327466.1 sodium ion-translocating decarboxylase subunit beta [Propionivibrio sp.]MBK7564576.1 sodium ion-translocating decarboxylase subunit beta [Propionivibrio sp.]MBK9029567.1 sodium ion-translocating decarboxylase subunit beta [Propionivibrio sp.]MBP6421501.1 sodium ion-translocating decarboxylase subunit beta [Propionivibrio sp.]SBT03441.1 Putative Na+-transporting decarboxylase, beta subuni